MPKTFVVETLCAVFHKVSKSDKVYGSEAGRRVSRFPSKTFRLTVPKIFVGESFCAAFQKISASEKVYGKEGRGEYQAFTSHFFVS